MTRAEAIKTLKGEAWICCAEKWDEALKIAINSLKIDEQYDLMYEQAEPKTGHWIEKDGFDGDVYYDCSECGESWTTIEGTPWDNGMNYCPNCGAKMESEDEG